MKKFRPVYAVLVLAVFVSCQKQQTEEEKKAEVEREVQQRLAAEHQAADQQKLTQREAELDAREKALAEKQNVTEDTPAPRSRAIAAAPVSSERENEGASYNTFYTKLEPYGEWRETSDYGYVWQPHVAEGSQNWHPYTEGRWVYTDAGWTWVSEEPFGWATYHYGRWTRLRHVGWVWVPGDEWAPAWVSWRKSDDYVGWAPLPPEAKFDHRRGIQNWSDNYYDVGPDQYRFVSTREFGTKQIERTIIPQERNVAIINLTTNVTNITYSNTTIVNQGPNYDELRSRTQQPIERLRLERQVNVDLNVEIPYAAVRGEVITMSAPAIGRDRSAERPRAVKENLGQAAVEHGWESVADRSAAEKTRAKMKAEATPPPDAPSKTFVKPAMTGRETATVAPVQSASPSMTPAVVRTQRRETPVPSPSSTPVIKEEKPTVASTPSPSVSMTPAPTRPHRITPLPTVAPSPSLSAAASPVATATIPPARATSTESSATARPRFSPPVNNPRMPKVSPSPSAESSPEKAETPPRLREHLKSRPGEFQPQASATPRGTPLATGSPDSLTKEDKRKAKPEGEKPVAGAVGSPTPSPSPQ